MSHSKSPLTYEEFKNIYSKVPRVCVEIIIKTEQGILFTLRKESTYYGHWHIPGGTLRYRERLHDAVKRVALDELGVKVTVEKLLGYIEYFSEEKERGFGYSISLVFLCNPASTDFKLNEQASEVRFFKSLPPNIVEEHREFIHNYFNIDEIK